MAKEVWTEPKAEAFLKRYVPVAKHIICKPDNVKKESRKFSYPLVLKLAAKNLVHKSDIGAVQIVRGAEELDKKIEFLMATAKKHRLALQGIIVQELVNGHQIIIGLKKDPTFGHCIMLGLGGIFVEVLKDVTFRVCPITEEDAEEMISELRGKKILDGFRGGVKANKNVLKKVLVKMSLLPKNLPKLEELDVNPMILNEKEAKVVDARIMIG